MPSVELFVVVH